MFIHLYGVDDASHLAKSLDNSVRSTLTAESTLTQKLLKNIKESVKNKD